MGVYSMTEERLAELRAIKANIKQKLKGKKFGTLPTKDKDALLETLAKMMGLREWKSYQSSWSPSPWKH